MSINRLPYMILECANAHGGDLDLLCKTINVFAQECPSRTGIKFQAFSYDLISVPDFKDYEIYKGLYLTPETWSEILTLAKQKGFDPWLDIFDLYGVEILKQNLSLIYGLKLQASVLQNQEVFSALCTVPLHNLRLMINVAGFSPDEIAVLQSQYSKLGAFELILQIGFQSYPTEIADTGLNKIAEIKSHTDASLCFADHVDATNDFATVVPVLAYALGCDYVEKHVSLDRSSAKYDHYSSLEPSEMRLLFKHMENTHSAISSPFISDSERAYLSSTNQAPMLKHALPAGSAVADSDIIYRRTSQKQGLNWEQIARLRMERSVLAFDKSEKVVLKIDDFKKAKVGIVVGCRLKSTRLKKKALLPIDGKASIARCLENCKLMVGADAIILATSTLAEDDELTKFATDGVSLYRGDPDDVIKRYVDSAKEFDVHHIVRVTGDCPSISPEIYEILLKSHLDVGADYTATNDCSVGLACEIYNVSALQRVLDYFGVAKHSEYMTWYMRQNPDVFKINIVSMNDFSEPGYRLTLDYAEDLRMFSKLYERLRDANFDATSENIFAVLKANPEIASINSAIEQKYTTDKQLIDMLNSETKIVL